MSHTSQTATIVSVLSTDALKDITGYERAGDVERCLKKQGIRIFYGRNGPWTTLDLINAAGGIIDNRSQQFEKACLL